MKYSLTQCKDTAIMVGLTEEQGEEFWIYFDSQGWLWPNGLDVGNLTSSLMRWRNNQHRFVEKKAKVKLFPLSGKTCYKCRLPAVYKDTGGDYDTYYCGECMPTKVKERYEA